MLRPQLETLPNFIMENGRKNLNPDRVSLLHDLISKMRLVSVEHQSNVLNRIGIVHIYLNEYEEALCAFQKSLSLKFCELVFSNYLQTLERLGKFKQAISEGLACLESHPNNRKVFTTLIDIISKYPDINALNKILDFFKYQYDADKVTEVALDFKSSMINEIEILGILDIDSDYFNLISNIAFIEVKKIQIGNIKFGSFLIEELDHLNVNVKVFGASKDDVKLLNCNFDSCINTLIEKSIISFETYIEHLPKFSFSFSLNNSLQDAA